MFTPGTLLAGKYELLEIAGQGGMATVWRARARGVGGFSKNLAIKVMLQRLCSDRHFVELFVEEARVSSQLQHPNVVQISDFGEHDGVYFLAMEWVDGLDLLDYCRSFTDQGYFMPWAALAIVAVEVLKGMHAAHTHRDEQGNPSPIFHRDVTPHNILLGVNGVVKLTDFGLAKATDRGTMTLPHVLKGKISYTAPEMTRGVRANARTDIFSLGVTLWEALAGRKMFDATSPLQVVKQIQAWSVPPLRDLRPDLPPDLILIVERAVARDPEQRYASAQELASALSSLLPPLSDMQRLGKSIADAKRRMQQNKSENLDHLKEALRPTGPAQAPSFRSAPPDGRAARVARPAPPPLPGQRPAAPPAPPLRRPPSTPPPALTRSAPPASVPIPSSSIPEVRISEKLPSLPSVSVVLDDLSAEQSAPPPPSSVSQTSLSLSITFEDSAVSPAPPLSPPPPPPPPNPPAAKPRPAPVAPQRAPAGDRPSPARIAATPAPPPAAPATAPRTPAATAPRTATAPAQATPPAASSRRGRPASHKEPSRLDISIELDMTPPPPRPAPPEKKK